MKRLIICLAVAFLISGIPAISSAVAASRTALIIGNANYRFAPLRNPVNDAQDVKSALENSGFTVRFLRDAGRRDILKAVREFGQSLSKGDVAMLYFSGHGVQVNGQNYLIPINADLKSQSDVPAQAVDLSKALEALASANPLASIIVLDACRNNPFPDADQAGGSGLARQTSTVPGMFVSYSTSPGAVALDGEGRNSPYTKNLVAALRTPGLSLENVFKRTLKAVHEDTGGQQTPWISSSFFGEFAFLPDAGQLSEQQHQTETKTPATGLVNRQVAPQSLSAPLLEGMYEARGSNPNGSTYKGTAFLSRIGNSWRFEWLIAGKTFHGIGEFNGKKLAIEWGDTNPVVYTVASPRRLEGIWAGGAATETLVYRDGGAATNAALEPAGAAGSIPGTYQARGKNPDGSRYGGTVKISRSGAVYKFNWKIGSQAYQGQGRLDGDTLTVDWGAAQPVIYQILTDGTLDGKWAGGKASEVLKRR